MSLSTEDHLAIQQLYVSYNHRIDFGTATEWSDCFSDDATFETGYSTEVGREAFVAFHEATRAMVPDIRHTITNVLIDGDANTARGSAYIDATKGAGPARELLTSGRYEDELVKTEAGWKFSKRTMIPDA